MKPNENMEETPAPKKAGSQLILHLILVAAILLIAAVAAYRLYKWNQGTPLDTNTEDIDTSQFDIETLDMIIPMDAARLEGREDDGITTILCLGNNPFSDDRGSTGLAAQLHQKPIRRFMTVVSLIRRLPANIQFTIRNTQKTTSICFMW